MLGEKESAAQSNAYCEPPNKDIIITGDDAPASVDWRTASPPVVSAIRDQASCGSCWTFAGITTIESAWAIATGNLYDLSEQQMVECVTEDYGCGGGMAYDVYQYAQSHNVYMEADWPYTARDYASCTY